MSAILKFDFKKRKQLRFSEENYLNYSKKDLILHVTFTLPLKQGETRTSSGPIPHPLSRQNREIHVNKKAWERNHVAKMLIINACVFFMFFVDLLTCLSILYKIGLFLSHWFSRVAPVTSLINSAINPLVYGATNLNYRKALQRAFFSSRLTGHLDTSAKRTDVDV